MWENDDVRYRSGQKHAAETVHNARTGHRDGNMDPRLDRNTSQQHGNAHDYTATDLRNAPPNTPHNYTGTRSTPQQHRSTDSRSTPQQHTATDSRSMLQNNSSLPPFSGMMVSGVGSSVSPSQALFNMPPPGYVNNRVPLNMPLPGFENTKIPPPGFSNASIPTPVFNNASIPLPGFNNASIPPPGLFNTNMPPPGYTAPRMPLPEYINNMTRPGINLAPSDNRLLGSVPPSNGTHSVYVHPPDRGMQGSVNINDSQRSNVLVPHMFLNNQGLTSLQIFPPNQINIAHRGGLTQDSTATPLASSNEQTATRIADQLWVTNFIEERKLSTNKETKPPKVGEAKQMLQKWFRLISEMEVQHDKLSERIKSGDSEWQREMQKTNILKEELLQIELEISSKYDMNSLQKEITRKKKKREWKNRHKRKIALEKIEIEKRNFEMHLQIDQWRKKEIAKDQAKFKASSMKKEAGGVLGDVMRKQADSSKGLSLLEALKKLRSFRKQEAELKGVYPKPSPEQNKEFDKRLAFLERLIKKHHELYEAEEKTLVVMLAEEEEEKEKERRERMHKRQLAQAAASDSSDPMREFYRYYTQADNGLDSLLHIRHGWDVCIVPETVPGASCIPPSNVTPDAPTSKPWSLFLKDNG